MSAFFICIKDVQEITDLKPSAAQRKLAKVRKAFEIEKYEQVPLHYYCSMFKLDMDRVIALLNKHKK